MTLKLIWDKFYVSIIFVLTCIVLGIILMCTVVGGGSDYSEVNVNEGDSLWALADQYAGKSDMAKADFVSWVEKETIYQTVMWKQEILLLSLYTKQSY